MPNHTGHPSQDVHNLHKPYFEVNGGSGIPQAVREDVTNGPHGPDRSIETVVSRAIKERRAQGRWLSREAAEKAIENLDTNKMKVNEPYSIPIPKDVGVIVRAYNQYPPNDTPASQRYLVDTAERALVIRRADGRIHTFPIGPEHPEYYKNAPTR